MQTIEKTIIQNLLTNESYIRKVIPFIKSAYFETNYEKIIFKKIKDFIRRYNQLPSRESLILEVEQDDNIFENDYKQIQEYLSELSDEKNENEDWLVEQTEKWCKDRAIYNAIMKSINIVDGDDKNLSEGAIPDLMQQALAVSFDTRVRS